MGTTLKQKANRQVFKRILSGVLDNVPVVGTIKQNVESDLGGKGSIDWIRLLSAVATFILILLVVLGKLSLEEADEINKTLNR